MGEWGTNRHHSKARNVYIRAKMVTSTQEVVEGTMRPKDGEFFIWNGDVAMIKNGFAAWEKEGRISAMFLDGGKVGENFIRATTKLELKLRRADKQRFLDKLNYMEKTAYGIK